MGRVSRSHAHASNPVAAICETGGISEDVPARAAGAHSSTQRRLPQRGDDT
jgi:hypothetical protein